MPFNNNAPSIKKVSDTFLIRRALFSVSDKTGIVELARAMADSGTEIVATGNTARVLIEAGLRVVPIEEISGSPEAFQGRMKTLSFPVCSGILYRRGDASDEADLAKLKIKPIDAVIVNFYPFEEAVASGASATELIEKIDIGGPTLVRAAAKNAEHVLVLCDPTQYIKVIEELRESRAVSLETSSECAARAWQRVLEYDEAIAARQGAGQLKLRYGENPHQSGKLWVDSDSPIAWPIGAANRLTQTELSYNNISDLSAAYGLASDLENEWPHSQSVVIVKHGNACGVALGKIAEKSQLEILQAAWACDPVSAFGGVLVFTRPLDKETAAWLAERFVELVAAPGLEAGEGTPLTLMLTKRKNLKAVKINRFSEVPAAMRIRVPGGWLEQTADLNRGETLKSVTENAWPASKERLGQFGVFVARSLKSNAVVLVREHQGMLQLLGAGQGQPNRIEALKRLAIPRAHEVINAEGSKAFPVLSESVFVSDAFFPFRDTVDEAAAAGIRHIIQPGGSLKDSESIKACNEHGVSMAFTGFRHFKH